MKPRKRGLLIFSIIIAVVLISSIVVVYLYYYTDLLKTNKQVFLKYLGQNKETYNIFRYEELEKIKEKQKNETYTFSGEITGEIQNENSYINNSVISIDGRCNKSEKKNMVDFNILYDDTNLFNFKYLNNDDKYALKSDEVVNAYLGIKNENMKETLSKLGINNKYIGDKITTTSLKDIINISEEEKQHIYNMYIPTIDAKILKDNYTKIKNQQIEIEGVNYNTNKYELKISKEQAIDIQISLLEKLKEDNITLNLLLSKIKQLNNDDNIELKQITSQIDKYITELNNMEKNNETFFAINLYVSDGQLVKTEIIKDDLKIDYTYKVSGIVEKLMINLENIYYNNQKNDINITIEKENATNEINTNINFEINNNMKSEKINISASNKGNVELNNIKNEYSLTIDNNEKVIKVNYTDLINFEDLSEEIMVLDNTNSAMINDFDSEMAKQLIEAIKVKLNEVYQQKLQIISML